MRVIHGHGTGRLQKAISGFLKIASAGRRSFHTAPHGAGRRRRDGRGTEGTRYGSHASFRKPSSTIFIFTPTSCRSWGTSCRCGRRGATWKGLCPFHGEKTPSFHVNREKGFFHCFGCGVGGDVIKFVELHEKVGFTEAVRMLAGRFGLAIPEPTEDRGGVNTAEREALLACTSWRSLVRRAACDAGGQRASAGSWRIAGSATAPVSRARARLRAAVARGLKTFLLGKGLRPAACSCEAASSCSATAARSSIGSAAG